MESNKDFYNPFLEYNANVLDDSKILEWFCSPLGVDSDSGGVDVYGNKMPIVFMGGRGSGKTMFLKYHSYSVRKNEWTQCKCSAILDFLNKSGGAGFYIRIDGMKLKSFSGNDLSREKWTNIFCHYLELMICKEYLDFVYDLEVENGVKFRENLIDKICTLLGVKYSKEISVTNLIDIIYEDINYIDQYRAEIQFDDVVFKPRKAFAPQNISFKLPQIIIEGIDGLRGDFNFIIMIDEYENFIKEQQEVVNTLIKFVGNNVTFRIGMRLSGFRTFSTTTSEEFIKENRDYETIIFEDIILKQHDYIKLLAEIANKRLLSVKSLRENNIVDIKKILGAKESLEKEAIEIVESKKSSSSKNMHFKLLNKKLTKKEKKLISCPTNPLMEVLNILYVNRGESPEQVNLMMNSFVQKDGSPRYKKYYHDYVNKYKMSLMFLLASSHKTNKMYYSFNTFCYLSSGIIGNFIELCRKVFRNMEFEDKQALLGGESIPRHIQSRAAKEHANRELILIERIEEYGHKLHVFAKNIGNIFREYHKDKNITYPETNQFYISGFDPGYLDNQKAFEAAIKWSVIQKKSSIQSGNPGSNKEDIYLLNRIFSPAFELTYRIRGGVSLRLDPSDFPALMREEIEPSFYFKRPARKSSINESGQNQLGLFGGNNEE